MQRKRPVLLTGASGTLGRLLAQRLGALGWTLRLSDRVAFPDAVPAGCSFVQADLDDRAAIEALVGGCGLVLHFGGVSTEHPFETILGPNLRGCFHVYEGARANKARVVFASSNHTVGFYERTALLDQDCRRCQLVGIRRHFACDFADFRPRRTSLRTIRPWLRFEKSSWFCGR